MEIFIDFLVNNYMWFLVITIVLIFSLIGYLVDSREQKLVGNTLTPQEMENQFEALAKAAQNKSISDAVKNAGKANMMQQNTIQQEGNENTGMNQNFGNPPMDLPQQNMNMNSNFQSQNPTSFEVLNK